MSLKKQFGFKGIFEENIVKHFGGAYLKNSNPKTKRPVTTKRPMHLVMRSSLAKGPLSLLKRGERIKEIIDNQGKTLGVKVYRQANAGNHLHLVVLPHSRRAFNAFVRAISGLIAREILGRERGKVTDNSLKKVKSYVFWDKRPFTQIVEWGRQYKAVCDYLLQNTLEALGFISYIPRKNKLIGVKTRSTA